MVRKVMRTPTPIFLGRTRDGGGGGYSLIRAYWGRAVSQGMFFGIFVLNRVSNLPFFVLIRVSIYQLLS